MSALKQIPRAKGTYTYLRQVIGFYTDIKAACDRIYDRHGEIVQVGSGPMAMTSLFGPDANQWVLQNRDDIFSSRLGWNFVIDKVFPGAIMSMDGDQHRFQRRIMQQAFKKPVMENYMQVMQPGIAEGLVRWHQQKGFLFYDHIKALTLDLAATIFMGIELGKKADKINSAFVDTVEASISPIRFPVPGTAMAKGMKGRQYLLEIFKELIPSKRAVESPDFFSQFCHARSEEGDRFTDNEIIDHMIFLMMAAHDTTTSTLSTMVFALAKYPEWQNKLRQEVMALDQKILAYSDLDKLEQMDWVMREALRMYPPLPSMPRRAMRDTDFKGYEIRKHTLVGITPIHTHYMKTLWSHPDYFDPLRFSPAREEHKNHAFSWIPFGGGAHMCIGQHFAFMQVKCILNQLLKLYWWDVEPGYDMPYQLVPIAKPKDGLPINLYHF